MDCDVMQQLEEDCELPPISDRTRFPYKDNKREGELQIKHDDCDYITPICDEGNNNTFEEDLEPFQNVDRSPRCKALNDVKKDGKFKYKGIMQKCLT